jgi:putative dimethyl sulfoxide reductase chaperone
MPVEKIEMGITPSVDMTPADVGKVNLGREKFYAFLSRLYAKEVDAETLETIIAVQPTIDLLASAEAADDLREGNGLLQKFVSHVGSLDGKERQDMLTSLSAEYADLFLGLRVKPLLTCESAYLGQFKMYYGRPFWRVKEAYKKSGFEKRKDFLEPEDHVAIELDFMANLCKSVRLSLDDKKVTDSLRYLAVQKEFLEDHALRWIPHLCETLKTAAGSNLYKSLAFLTKGFISTDAGVVDELTERLKLTENTRL